MLKTANSCWRDHPDVVHDFTALIKKTVTETVDAAKKKKKKVRVGVKAFKTWILEKLES